MAKTELTLVLPGLAAILEQKINASIIPTYLAKILSKSEFKKQSIGVSRLLFNSFSANALTESDLPMVSLEMSNKIALRADPCYLHADRDRLLLFSDMLDITKEESTALIAEIQPLFDDFGGVLTPSTANNWLLELQSLPDLNFSALSEVSGQSVDSYLPKGKEQQDWIRLWNEVQMKLYASEINQRRTENNKLPINSIWFWGAGHFEAKTAAWTKVQGNSLLLKQLADKSITPIECNADFTHSSLSAGKHLWLADEINIDEACAEQLQVLDNTLFQPLWHACRTAKIATITLQIPNHGDYKLSSLDCWKFWKT